MHKKFLWTSVLLAFLLGANSSMGGGPGAEEWIDNEGLRAPAQVRKAADALWDAVDDESDASLNAGWGFEELDPDCGCTRCQYCCMTCGITECVRPCATDSGEYGSSRVMTRHRDFHLQYEQKTSEVMKALAVFRDAVNGNVVGPELYSGDAAICELGPWCKGVTYLPVQDGLRRLYRAKRDLSHIPESSRNFVNLHGGWKPEQPLGSPDGNQVHQPLVSAPMGNPFVPHEGGMPAMVPYYSGAPVPLQMPAHHGGPAPAVGSSGSGR